MPVVVLFFCMGLECVHTYANHFYIFTMYPLYCLSNLRQCAGGDISNKNLWLAENVLEILVDQR